MKGINIMKPTILNAVSPQYIVDDKGKRTGVVLDVKTFTSMIEELEDLRDIVEAEKILEKGENEEGPTIDEIEKSLDKED
jgi:PHD/YefM family antitoxin component YafN of YafNO toxin-antitoxin module